MDVLLVLCLLIVLAVLAPVAGVDSRGFVDRDPDPPEPGCAPASEPPIVSRRPVVP